jgi:hypothetical protein
MGLCFRLIGNKGARRRQPEPLQSERNPSIVFKGRWYEAIRQPMRPDTFIALDSPFRGAVS